MTGVRDDDLARSEGIALDSLPKWLRDLIDINNEYADRETGRAKRFLASSGEDGPDSEKKKEERQFTALMRLLQDPEYARLYTQAANMVQDIEDAAARALSKLETEGEAAAQKLDEIKDSAATLPDGRRVYQTDDGRLLTEDGEDVSARRGDVRGSTENTPSWEEYKRAKDALDDIERRKREIDDYMRDVIDPLKRRLADPNNPPSKEELEEILRKLRESQPADIARAREQREPDEAKKFANTSTPANSAAADELVPAKGVDAPDMFAQFRSASSVVSNADPFAPMPGGPKHS